MKKHGLACVKKALALCLAALMLAGLCACGGGGSASTPKDSGTTESAANEKKETTYLSFGTGTTGGVFYTAGIGFGTLLNDKSGYMNVTVEATKASAENINMMNQGTIELATCSFPTTLQGHLGEGSWKGNPQDVQVLFNMYGNPIHVIVMSDSPYQSMEDLKGKTISVGQAGSGNYNSTVALLEGVYGWVDGVDYKAEYLSYTESVEAFKNGQIDAAVFDTVSPHSTIIDLASWKPIRLLSVDENLLSSATNPYAQQFYTITIPANTYNGQTEDVVCAAHGNYVCTTSNLSEELGYDICNTIFSNLDYVATVHDALSKLTVESGCETGGLPMHIGAMKFFKEQGLDVDSLVQVAERS